MEQRYVILITKGPSYFCLEYGLAKRMQNLLQQIDSAIEDDTNVTFVDAGEIEYSILKRLVDWLRKDPSLEVRNETTKRETGEVLRQFCDEYINSKNEIILAMASGAAYLGLPVLLFMLRYLIKQKILLLAKNINIKKYGKSKYSKDLRATLHKQSISIHEEKLAKAKDALEETINQMQQSIRNTASDTQTWCEDTASKKHNKLLISGMQSDTTFMQSLNSPKQHYPYTHYDNKGSFFISENQAQAPTGSKWIDKNENHQINESLAYGCETTKQNVKHLSKQTETNFSRYDDLSNQMRCACCLKDIQTSQTQRVDGVNASFHENKEQKIKPVTKVLDMTADHHNDLTNNPKASLFSEDIADTNYKHNKYRKGKTSTPKNKEKVLNLKMKGKSSKKNRECDIAVIAERNSLQPNKTTDATKPHQKDEIIPSDNEKQLWDKNAKRKHRGVSDLHDNGVNNELQGFRCAEDNDRYICNQIREDKFSVPDYKNKVQHSKHKKHHTESEPNFNNDFPNDMKCYNCNGNISIRDYYYYKKRQSKIRMMNQIRKFYKKNFWLADRINNVQTQTPAYLDPSLSKGVQVNSLDENVKTSTEHTETNHLEDFHTDSPHLNCDFCEKLAKPIDIAEMRKEIYDMQQMNNLESLVDTEFLNSASSSSLLLNDRGVTTSALNFCEKPYSIREPYVQFSNSGRIINNGKEPSQMEKYLSYWESKILGNKLEKHAEKFKPNENVAHHNISFGIQTDPVHSVSQNNAEVQTFLLSNTTSSSVQTEVFYGMVNSETQANFIEVRTESSQTDFLWNSKNTGSQTEIFWFIPNFERQTKQLEVEAENNTNLQASPHSNRIPQFLKRTEMLDVQPVDGGVQLNFPQKRHSFQMSESNSTGSEN